DQRTPRVFHVLAKSAHEEISGAARFGWSGQRPQERVRRDREGLADVPETSAAWQLFAQVADDHVALGVGAERARQPPGPKSRSRDSMPRHSRMSARRESFSERTAAGVTVK